MDLDGIKNQYPSVNQQDQQSQDWIYKLIKLTNAQPVLFLSKKMRKRNNTDTRDFVNEETADAEKPRDLVQIRYTLY